MQAVMKHDWELGCSEAFFDTAASIGSIRILSSAKTLVSELQPKTLVLSQGLSQWISLGVCEHFLSGPSLEVTAAVETV